MDFSDRELKVLLQALYRYRGEVSGATQSEQNKASAVEKVIGKIEGEIGPLVPEKTGFDREMEESLSVLKSGKAGLRGAKAAAEKGKAKPAGKAELDKGKAAPKVKKASGASKPAARSAK